jgi:hypothetical protein
MSDASQLRDTIYKFIIDFKQKYDGLGPRLRDIADHVMLSESTVKYHLMVMEIEGRIRFLNRPGIEVVGGVWELRDEDESGASSGQG